MKWLNDELNTRGWSQAELARRSPGVSRPLVNLVAAGKQPPSYEFCAAIAKPLGKRPEELFRLAGLLPQRRPDDEVTFQDFVELGLELTHEERTRVMEYALTRFLARRRGHAPATDAPLEDGCAQP